MHPPLFGLFRCCAIVVGASPSLVCAQPISPPEAIGGSDGLELSGSVRVRYEVLEGQPRVGLRANDEQLSLRTTLLGEYRSGNFRIGGEIYDSRAYLDKKGSSLSANEVNALELVQAYVGAEFSDVLSDGNSARLQLGRMTLNLGSRRLVAADDYRNTTNGYTGVRADLRTRGGITATLSTAA